MSIQDIIRAWKDADYRQSLSEDEQALLPEHPAGVIELHAGDLEQVTRAADQQELVFGSFNPHCPTSHGILWWSER
jgi:mersacidin/lichenicidin family type 2 lantibiotic